MKKRDKDYFYPIALVLLVAFAGIAYSTTTTNLSPNIPFPSDGQYQCPNGLNPYPIPPSFPDDFPESPYLCCDGDPFYTWPDGTVTCYDPVQINEQACDFEEGGEIKHQVKYQKAKTLNCDSVNCEGQITPKKYIPWELIEFDAMECQCWFDPDAEDWLCEWTDISYDNCKVAIEQICEPIEIDCSARCEGADIPYTIDSNKLDPKKTKCWGDCSEFGYECDTNLPDNPSAPGIPDLQNSDAYDGTISQPTVKKVAPGRNPVTLSPGSETESPYSTVEDFCKEFVY